LLRDDWFSSAMKSLARSLTDDLRIKSAAGRWVLAATILGSSMAAIDSTVVSIAIPSIGRQFHAPLTSLQWVVTGYMLTLSALLLTGGALGDRFGRRRVFVVGVTWFAVASAACALASNVDTLIALRLLQGIGAALLTPGSLAILQASFAKSDRAQAVGVWTALGGVASAVGPFVGGYLVTAASWRWIFLINFPIGVLVLAASVRHVPESRDPEVRGHFDLLGTILAVVALAGITFGLIEGPSRGWSASSVRIGLVVGTCAGIGFVATELRVRAPTLPLFLFRNRQFSVTNAVTFVVYAALGGTLFLLPIELQVGDGYSPLESGVSLLPLTAIMLTFSAPSGRLASRIGPRLQMASGPIVVGLGLALLGRASSDPSYWAGVLPAVVIFAAGLAITVAPLTATALSSAPQEHVGTASAVNNVVARLGGLIAVAVLPALAGIDGQSYLRPRDLGHGFHTATLIAGGLCVAGGIVAAIGIRNDADMPSPGDEQARNPLMTVSCALDAPSLAG
jgi:EmrB/QacA subfamily drug resistance transporter